MEYIVQNGEAGIRIDKYISKKEENISRVAIARMIENGNILVNGKQVKTSYKVLENDNITMEKEEVKEIEIKPENIPLDIVYEDNDIIVVNKQKGLVVHPGNGNVNGTLVNAIMAYCKDSYQELVENYDQE